MEIELRPGAKAKQMMIDVLDDVRDCLFECAKVVFKEGMQGRDGEAIAAFSRLKAEIRRRSSLVKACFSREYEERLEQILSERQFESENVSKEIMGRLISLNELCYELEFGLVVSMPKEKVLRLRADLDFLTPYPRGWSFYPAAWTIGIHGYFIKLSPDRFKVTEALAKSAMKGEPGLTYEALSRRAFGKSEPRDSLNKRTKSLKKIFLGGKKTSLEPQLKWLFNEIFVENGALARLNVDPKILPEMIPDLLAPVLGLTSK